MHEMSLCENVLQVLQDSASSQNFQRVKTVWLEIGELSCVEIEALRFSFSEVCKYTLADSAKLEITIIPGRAKCLSCGRTVAIKQRFDACSTCNNHQLQVFDGEDMRIKELEVE